MSNQAGEKVRPSVYLSNKASTLNEALRFFDAADTQKLRVERHLCFLSQLDFWEWQVDDLIYSFDTFRKRSQDWESTHSIADNLIRQGFLIKTKSLIQVRQKRNHPFLTTKLPKVVAPEFLFKTVLETWNALLDAVENSVLKNPEDVENFVEQLGADLHINLQKFKKVVSDDRVKNI